ncbi:MAG: pyridoxal-phosphate dependent enzyme [Acidobacteria bacterium]|nr:pyridoxal-phosphate dependent enzyme [Acidobacteriota bacterium]MXZ72454.1 pyridoxal-phosphate dependent enzyme [Acidobacteriota bacterium]MYD70209.1 pyridoxal-phosphate dependent enzyme [Acidobacteriota bacterium]MYJ05798.1 pyridoxal-phosphate dependent enzyme [Acidobacteriota bacterium]
MSNLVTVDAIRAAADRIAAVARRTPILDVSPAAGRPLHLKCENLQRTGAFKIRGGFNLISQLAEAGGIVSGVITYSSGNHAQAVACSARMLGLPAVVVMPTTAPAVKVEGTKAFGAEVMFEGTTSVERRRRAEVVARERNLTIIPPFDHPEIIAGQGTVGLEIVEDLPGVATVYVPIGGGGLASGVAAAVKALRPDARVIGVEPVGAAAMLRSVEAGGPVTLDRVASVADGLIPIRPGDLTYAHAAALIDRIVTVEDDAILDAVRWLAARAHLVVEPSGAATMAAILSGAGAGAGGEADGEGGATVAVLSGGNIAPDALARLLSADP